MASALSLASDLGLDNGLAQEDELDDQDAKEHRFECVLIADLANGDDFIVTSHGRKETMFSVIGPPIDILARLECFLLERSL